MARKQPYRNLNQFNQFLDRGDPILKQFLLEIAKYPILSNSEIVELVKKAQSGDTEARKKVCEHNLRLVVKVAKQFQSINISINDLIQEGYLGVNLAIDKFMPSKGVPFSHFAVWWIKMKILKYIWWYQTTVRLPETQRMGINKLAQISARFISEHGTIPSMQQLLDQSGLSERMVSNYLDLFNHGNLQSFLNIEDIEDETLLPVENVETAGEEIDQEIVKNAIEQCISTLTPRQQEFLRDYYGIGRSSVSVTEMARRRKCTTENIRQRRAALVEFLQENCSEDLAPYIE